MMDKGWRERLVQRLADHLDVPIDVPPVVAHIDGIPLYRGSEPNRYLVRSDAGRNLCEAVGKKRVLSFHGGFQRAVLVTSWGPPWSFDPRSWVEVGVADLQ